MKREEPNDNERPWVNLSGEDTTMGEDSVRDWDGPTVNVGDSDEPGSAGGTAGQAPANNQYYSRFYEMLLEAYKADSLKEKYESEKNELVKGWINNSDNWSPELRKIQKQKIKAIDQAYEEISDPGRTHICTGCGTNIAPLLAQYPNMKICPVCNKNIERIKTKEEEEKELYGRRQKLTQDYGTQQHQDPKKENDGITVVVNNNHGDVEDKNGIGKGIIAVLCIALAVGFAVWAGKDFSTVPGKNVPTATAQTDNSASLKSRRETEKSAREESEKKQRETEAAELSKEADSLYDAKRYSEALSKYMEAYNKGYKGDEFRIGSIYYKGQNYSEAVNWFRKSAEQDNAYGQVLLGIMYENGDGVEKDYSEAVRWYRKAAEHGFASGQNNLGLMYKNGNGVEKDYSEALKWFHKSAEQGDAEGQYNLGNMYLKGYGVDKDDVEAVKWFHKSAEQGDADAQVVLGLMYYGGDGVDKNYSEAERWIRKPAEQGNALGQCILGLMYEHGDGVPKSNSEAIKWYEKSAAQGNEIAKNQLKALRGY